MFILVRSRRCPSLPCRAFLPVNGAKDAFAYDFANRQRCKKSAEGATACLLPVHGEKVPEGRMRGGANFSNRGAACQTKSPHANTRGD
ncbi:hypothetical protein FJ987_17500 [Mesorhizobium sp. CU2]|nr:hypothetical protein FJ988_24930 [Mesorhizobium sp. CU3]TPO12138.1 hypothetical protein FJ987_17500 [Mesorhizobium sp. CU2]